MQCDKDIVFESKQLLRDESQPVQQVKGSLPSGGL